MTRSKSLAKELGDDEAGFATVFTAGLIGVLVSVLLVLSVAGGRVIARHQARVAADLSAVAGAGAHFYGDDACAAARHVAQLNGASAAQCQVQGEDVFVETVVEMKGLGGLTSMASRASMGGLGKLSATAKAGPI